MRPFRGQGSGGRPALPVAPGKRWRSYPHFAKRGAQAWANVAREGLPAGINLLHVHSITDGGADGLLLAADRFVAWASDMGFASGTAALLDEAASRYCESRCYVHDGHHSEGGKLLNALTYLYPELTPPALPLTRRAVVGWQRVTHSVEGQPFSVETWGAIMSDLLTHGQAECALVVAVCVDAYLRLMDFDALLCSDVAASAAQDERGTVASERVGLQLGVAERGEEAKTGVDQSVIIERDWVAALLWEHVRDRPPHQRAFFVSRSAFEYQWYRTLRRLDLGFVGGPHAMRHTGPTIDALLHNRSRDHLRVRGRWASLKSVGRYCKPNSLLRHNSRVPHHVLASGRDFWTDPLGCFLAAKATIRPRSGR